MNFLDALTNAAKSLGNAQKQISSTNPLILTNVTPEAVTAPKPRSRSPSSIVTFDEVERRVNMAFDRAVEQKNSVYLQGVAAFIHSSSSLSDNSAYITIENPASGFDIHQWCLTNFEDLIDDVKLQLVCSVRAIPRDIALAQSEYVSKLSLSIDQLLQPRVAGRSEKLFTDQNHEPLVAVLRYSGIGIAAILRRYKEFIRERSESMMLSAVSDSEMSQVSLKMRKTLYLASVLSDSQALDQLCSSRSEPEELDRGSPVQSSINAHSLPAELADALASRISLIRRRIGAGKGMWTSTTAKGYLAEFHRALKANDPMEIAAISCEFWLNGSTLKPSTVQINNRDSFAIEPELPKSTDKPMLTPQPPTKPHEEELLTTDELALRIRYDSRTLRERLKDSVLFHEVHYIRPFGGRKILWRWDAVQKTLGINGHSKLISE